MERSFVNSLILPARLTQIACGLIVFSCALVATVRAEDYDYTNDHDPQFASIFLGAGVALFGVFGLFGCKQRADEPDNFRLSSLILFMDCWTLFMSFGAGILLTVQVNSWQWEYVGPDALLYIPTVVAFICGGFVILPLIIRTSRLWWKVLRYSFSQHSNADKEIALESGCAHTCCHQHHSPGQDIDYTERPAGRRSYHTEAVKSSFSSRPQSVISGADTLTYPNIGDVAQTAPPTRAPSHYAPSYTSRVEVGSKVQRS